MTRKLNLSKPFKKTGLVLGLLITSAVILVACGGGGDSSSSSSATNPNAVTTLITSVNGASNTACGRNVQCINAPLAYQGTDITLLLAQPMGQVSGTNSPWTNPTTNIMTLSQIPYVSGSNSATVYDPAGSQFSMTTDNTYQITGFAAGSRIFLGNGLPSTLMGNFPVQPGDPAYSYYVALPGGTNPDTGQVYSSAAAIGISPYALQSYIPLTPIYSNTPNTIQSLIVGITLTGGVWHFEKAPNNADVLFNPTNALPTDQCFGHPYYEQYHYHGYSWKCFPNQGTSGQSPVFGFALDGYPITGPRAADGHMLTNAELDECHGTTSTITMPDGSSKNTYHYVLNREYPYSVGCFRGKVNYVQALGQGLSNNLMKEGLTYVDNAVGN